MPEQRTTADGVNAFWDALVLGQEATGADLEPDVAAAIRRFQSLGSTLPVTARERVWQQVQAAAITRQEGDEAIRSSVVLGGADPIIATTRAHPTVRPRWEQPRWMLAQLATAALLVLTLVASFLLLGPPRINQGSEAPALIPAISATPATPEATEVVAEYLWETQGPTDQPIDHPGLLAIDADGNLWIPNIATSQIQIYSPDGTFLEAWGKPGNGEGQFDFMWHREQIGGGAVAFDHVGNIYVVDEGNFRIHKFAPDRSFLLSWGGQGSGDGQFIGPDSIAVDAGRVYVADGDRDDVQVFDSDGNYLDSIGGFGLGEGQFYFLCGSGVAFAPNGDLLVSDACAHRVQRFSPEGTYLSTIGGVGSGDGQFNHPNQIAVDGAGRIFVADLSNRRIQVFAEDGTFLGVWGGFGTGPGRFVAPLGIAVDGKGHVYVSDFDEDRLMAFQLLPPFGPGQAPAVVADPAPTEAKLAEYLWETAGGPALPLEHPGHPALDPSGNLWVPDAGSDRFQIFSPDGRFLEVWGESGSGDGQFEFHADLWNSAAIAFAPDGAFYVVDTGNRRIQKFGPDRAFVTAWGEEGFGPGQFNLPNAIAVDARGRVYVTDDGRHDVQVFDTDGTYLRTIGERGVGDGQFFFAGGSAVHVDTSDTIWVSDGSNHRIQMFSPEGELLNVWSGGPGDDQLKRPGQLGVDAEGRVFVTAPEIDRVQVFNREGEYLGSWGSEGRGPGQFIGPSGLVLDGQGNIYVAGYDDARIQKFRLAPILESVFPRVEVHPDPVTPVAEFVWQNDGDPDLPLEDPTNLAIDPQGNIWVTDGRNSRFQIFAPDGTFLETWGTPGEAEGELDFVEPTLFGGYGAGSMAFDAEGNLYVADPGNYRIQKFGPDRSFITAWGSYGLGDGQFAAILNLAIDAQGRVYVTDESRGDVQLFDADGNFQSVWSQSAEDWLGKPSVIEIDAAGNLWFTHFQKHAIQKYSPDGRLLASWGELGFEAGQLNNPSGLAIDEQGRIFVSEWANNRIQVFDGDGSFIASWGISGSDAGEFMGPNGSVLDGLGNIYVAEDGTDRIQKFRLLPPLAPD
jgi:DNA-binding beta-propeller fold protein YncE